MKNMRSLVDGLPSDLAPLADLARKLLDESGAVSHDGILRIGHRPWIAPENYVLTLFPGLSQKDLQQYATQFTLVVPQSYAMVLRSINGAFCFGISLAGLPASMLGSPPLLDRSRLQCHDLGTANTYWKHNYKKIPAGAFHIGSREYSDTENVGYFIVNDQIVSLRQSGRVSGEWDSWPEFLADELRASEALDAKWNPRRPVL